VAALRSLNKTEKYSFLTELSRAELAFYFMALYPQAVQTLSPNKTKGTEKC
jgi:hypothetical protein